MPATAAYPVNQTVAQTSHFTGLPAGWRCRCDLRRNCRCRRRCRHCPLRRAVPRSDRQCSHIHPNGAAVSTVTLSSGAATATVTTTTSIFECPPLGFWGNNTRHAKSCRKPAVVFSRQASKINWRGRLRVFQTARFRRSSRFQSTRAALLCNCLGWTT